MILFFELNSFSQTFHEDRCKSPVYVKKEESQEYSCFLTDEEGYVIVYTDGSCLSNGQKGAKSGIGVWFGDDHPL